MLVKQGALTPHLAFAATAGEGLMMTEGLMSSKGLVMRSRDFQLYFHWCEHYLVQLGLEVITS